jgi:hypothetical protein
MSWLIDALFAPEVLVVAITAVVAIGLGIWIGRGTVQRPRPQPARSLQRSGITAEQLRNELRKYAAQQPAVQAAPPAPAAPAKPMIKHVQDPKLLQEHTDLRHRLEDLTNDQQQSAVTIYALNRRNEGLAQSLQERDQLLGHLERQVLGAGSYA